MVLYSFPYLRPSINQLAMFYQFLANTFPAPSTVRNYFSGARSWVYLHGGDTAPFVAQEMSTMAKAIKDNSTHVVAQAPPILPSHIRTICRFLDNLRIPVPAIKAAILLAYATFCRASNVVSPALNQWGGPHTLLAGDVFILNGGLQVIIRSTKTRGKNAPHSALILPTQDFQVCPVRAWLEYKRAVNPCPLGPAFIVSPSKPLTAHTVVAIIRAALASAGVTNPGTYTFHSLRRGATQAAARAGATEEQLIQHGTWSSRAGLRTYLQPPPRIVPRLLAGTLA